MPAKEGEWARLFRLLRTASGVDFTFYKKSTIRRRLARRMALHKIESIGEYLKFLEAPARNLTLLFGEILIHVTSFFRDPTYSRRCAEDSSTNFGGEAPGEPVRIWVPGCSTGEEAYSIAICLLEHLGDRASDTPIQIFATDISDAAIGKARAASYSEEEMRRYRRSAGGAFHQANGKYSVNVALRELCVFARQDVTKDPPFSKLDLISCRNVLIYLRRFCRRKCWLLSITP